MTHLPPEYLVLFILLYIVSIFFPDFNPLKALFLLIIKLPSSSFPAVFTPCEFKEHAFMDGGTLDNVPVHEVKKQGADKVIAVILSKFCITESYPYL